ncbi:Importin subunit alpha [Seminavis robusta]|uniref:Importin subunit alpha n=1 Tax=Seminavis robusta TaxID=568900 RepID=A0A9N8EYY6_9STRA|nr:Importin subunit alpha [Seminavis robusta]|eukprot:Sro2493_g329210.1 Importin subunit alpha (418) ;mRNA; r:3237-4490
MTTEALKTGIPEWAAGLLSSDLREQERCAVEIRRLLSSGDSKVPFEDLIQAGVVPSLVKLLTKPSLQEDAVWALSNLASGPSKSSKALIDHGAIPALVQLLSTTNDVVIQDHAVMGLGNLASGNGDAIVKAGGLTTLLDLLQEPRQSLDMVRQATWALGMLYREPPNTLDSIQQALPTLQKLLDHKDEEVLGDTVWAYAHILADSSDIHNIIGAVVESGDGKVVSKLVEFLHNDNTSIQRAALKALAGIAAGNDHHIQSILDCKNSLTDLQKVIAAGDNEEEALRVVANLCGGITSIQVVIDSEIVRFLMQMIQNGGAPLWKKKPAAEGILCLARSANTAQMRYLISEGYEKWKTTMTELVPNLPPPRININSKRSSSSLGDSTKLAASPKRPKAKEAAASQSAKWQRKEGERLERN